MSILHTVGVHLKKKLYLTNGWRQEKKTVMTNLPDNMVGCLDDVSHKMHSWSLYYGGCANLISLIYNVALTHTYIEKNRLTSLFDGLT